MSKTDLSKFDNFGYSHGRSLIIRGIWILVSRVFFQTSLPFSNAVKAMLLRIFGAKIGTKVVIKPGIQIKHPWNLAVSDSVWIGERVWIDNLAMVTIASNVCISQGAYLCTGNHDFKSRTFGLITKPIELEEGVWIGAFACLGPGVTAKSHSILTMGSVLTKDMEAYGIYQGNPAELKTTRNID